jgi:hypothetical protein
MISQRDRLKQGNIVPERTLSSAWTFWAKYLFPVMWISGFGFGTILLWSGGFVSERLDFWNDSHPVGKVRPVATLKLFECGVQADVTYQHTRVARMLAIARAFPSSPAR